MSDPKVLTDALVEKGILVKHPHGHDLYQLTYEGEKWLAPEVVITDWRVAGKVLESTPGGQVPRGLPRAIIEAWFEAQEGEGE